MTPEVPARLQVGEMLSHYRVTDTLGAGGMGVVYCAVDTRLNRPVALKVIGDGATAADRRQRFLSEARVKATVFLGGGLSRVAAPAEIDPLNFAPRIGVPTLMVNGKGDFQFPFQTSQLPLFRRLSLPADRKRHALFEGGHLPTHIHDVMREMLDWYDRFLGPVTPITR